MKFHSSKTVWLAKQHLMWKNVKKVEICSMLRNTSSVEGGIADSKRQTKKIKIS